jgi:anti-sigma B factor antagonist
VDTFSISDEAIDRGVHVIPVLGYVDFDAAPQLKRRIVQRIDEGGRRLVVDLSGAGFIDSTGIGVLVGALKRLREMDGSLAVVCPDHDMRNIFEIVGLEEVIPLHTSRDDAVSAIAAAA